MTLPADIQAMTEWQASVELDRLHAGVANHQLPRFYARMEEHLRFPKSSRERLALARQVVAEINKEFGAMK
jgi:hypothetical protein